MYEKKLKKRQRKKEWNNKTTNWKLEGESKSE